MIIVPIAVRKWIRSEQQCLVKNADCKFVVDDDECEYSYFDDIYGCECPECDTRSPSVGDYKKW